jgi:hypothetical protein
MAVDVATLAIGVDSTAVNAAGAQLDALRDRAVRVETATRAIRTNIDTRPISDARSQYDALEASVVQLRKAQADYATMQDTVAKAVARGTISAQEGKIVLAQTRSELALSNAALGEFGHAHERAAGSSRQMYEGMVLVHEFLRGDWRRMVSSATIELQNFGLMGTVLKTLFNPLTLGLTATAAAFAIIAARASSISTSVREFTVAMKAMGDVAGFTGAQLRELSNQMVQQGASREDANKAIESIIRQRELQGDLARQVASLSTDVAAGLGIKIPDAAKKLGDALSGGFNSVKKLDDELGLFSVAELNNMRVMAEHGDRAGVLEIAIQKLHERFDGLDEESISPAGKALRDFENAYDALVERLATHPMTIKILGFGAKEMQLFERLISNMATPDFTPAGEKSDEAWKLLDQINQKQDELKTAQDHSATSSKAYIDDLKQQLDGLKAKYNEVTDAAERLGAVRAGPTPTPTMGAESFGAGSFDMGGGASAPPPAQIPIPGTKPIPPGTVADEKSLKTVNETIAANDKLAKAMGQVGVARELAIAKSQAEQENLDKGYGKVAAAINIHERQREVLLRLGGQINDVVNGLDIEAAAMQRVAGVTDASNADIHKAEIEAQAWSQAVRLVGVNSGALPAVYDRIRTAMLALDVAQRAVEFNKLVATTNENIEASKRLAAAYGEGAIAGHDQEIANKAYADALRLAGGDQAKFNEEYARLLALYKQDDAAKRAADLAKWTDEQNVATEQAKLLADAEMQGADAVREANVQIKVNQALRQQNTEAGTAEAEAIEKTVRALEDENSQRQKNAALRKAQEGLQDAQAALAIQASSGGSDAAAARQLAMYQKYVELKRDTANKWTPEEIDEQVKLAGAISDTQTAQQQLQQAQEAWLAPFKDAVSSIQSSFSDMFETIFKGGTDGFKNFADSVKDIFLKMLAQLATQAMFQPLFGGIASMLGGGDFAQQIGFNPFMMAGGGMGGGIQGTGGFNGVVGQIAAGPGGSGAVSGGSWGNGFSMPGIGGLLNNSSFGGLFTTGGNPFSATVQGPGMGSAGLLPVSSGQFLQGGMMGFGAGTLLNSLIGGNSTNGMIGSGVGSLAGAAIGSIVPGIGTVVGGLIGGLLGGGGGGMFGPGKSAFSEGGDINLSSLSFRDAGGGTDAAHQANIGALSGITGNIQNQIRSLTKQTGGTASGTLGVVVDDNKLEYNINQQNYRRFAPGDAQGLVDAAVLDVARSLTGISDNLRTAFQHITTAQDIQPAIDFVKQYEQIIKDSGETATGAEKQLADLNSQFADLKDAAAGYGLSVQALDDALAKSIAKMRDDYNKQISDSIEQLDDPKQFAFDQLEQEHQQAIKDATALGADINKVEELYGKKRLALVEQFAEQTTFAVKSATDQLKQLLAQLTVGPQSALSPGDQYAAARKAFEDAATQGRTEGRLPNEFATIVQQFLDASKQMFASSERYASDYKETTDLLNQLLGTPKHAGGGLATGWNIVGERGPELVNFGAGAGAARIFSSGSPAPSNDNSDVVAAANLMRREQQRTNELLSRVVELLERGVRRVDSFNRPASYGARLKAG